MNLCDNNLAIIQLLLAITYKRKKNAQISIVIRQCKLECLEHNSTQINKTLILTTWC